MERRGEERRGEERRGEERRGEERRGEERRGEERRGEERARHAPGDNLADCDLSIYLFLDQVFYLFIYLFICCLFLNLLADYL